MCGALANRIIVCSGPVRDRFPTWARHKVRVIHNACDLERFRPDRDGAAARAALGIPAEVPLVGFVGRFIPWKGVDIFLRAAATVRAEVPHAHFLVVGSRLAGYDAYVRLLHDLIERLGLAASVTVLEDRTDVPDLMAAVDVLVHCSIRPEPFGLVITEGMASGKPVVAADDGGLPEIISSPEVGVLAPPGDADAYARTVIQLLRDSARRRAIGHAAREHVERHFEVGTIVRQAEQVYLEALGAKRPAGPGAGGRLVGRG